MLDATELNEFNSKCFDTPLQLQELEGIKDAVRLNTMDGIALTNTSPAATPPSEEEGLTEAGFLYLHLMFIQRGRLETTWTVLRKFGYAEDLQLRESFLAPKYVYPRHAYIFTTY